MTNIIVTTKDELEGLIESSIRKALHSQIAPQDSKHEDFMTIDEAAKYLNLAKQTLYGFTSKNLIPFIKNGKRVLFRKIELEAWVLEGKQKTVSEIQKEYEGRK